MIEKIGSSEEKLNTIIGQGTVFKGECSVKGTVRVDGTIDGTLSASGIAILGKTGEIKGDLVVLNAVVGGRVNGSVIAEGRLELQSGARVDGDIKAKKLVVEEGVFFQGYCNMREAAEAQAAKTGAPHHPPEALKDAEVKRKKVEESRREDSDEQITFQGEPI
ncbi:MAG TPA: polymer-forming cytoskeletal protein [archaeon]|nr:polymer-forming cytoskeletal protein [archaeon]